MKTEKILFKNNKNETISGKIYSNEQVSPTGVIFCHGLFSSKDAYKITRLAPAIVNAGLTLMTFNFSFIEQNQLNKISINQELLDLEAAIKSFYTYGITELHIIGSSLGGVIATLYAAQHNENILSFISIATPFDLPKLVAKLTGKNNKSSFPPGKTTLIDDIPMDNSFFIEALAADTLSAVHNITIPLLVIHGAQDDVVDISNVSLIKEHSRSTIKTEIIDDGSHNLVREKDISILHDSIIPWLSGGYNT